MSLINYTRKIADWVGNGYYAGVLQQRAVTLPQDPSDNRWLICEIICPISIDRLRFLMDYNILSKTS